MILLGDGLHNVLGGLAAFDPVPEVNRHHDPFRNALHFACFVGGLLLLWALASAPS